MERCDRIKSNSGTVVACNNVFKRNKGKIISIRTYLVVIRTCDIKYNIIYTFSRCPSKINIDPTVDVKQRYLNAK